MKRLAGELCFNELTGMSGSFCQIKNEDPIRLEKFEVNVMSSKLQ